MEICFHRKSWPSHQVQHFLPLYKYSFVLFVKHSFEQLFKCHEQQLLSIIWIGFIPCQPARVLKTAACIDCIHRSLD